MKAISTISFICFLFLQGFFLSASGQEAVGPLRYNAALANKRTPYKALMKTTATAPLSLPFFEDFLGYDVYPDSTKWTDNDVYINNTMCVSPICRGVATFDALDPHGIPYDSFSNTVFRYADSLTSQPINMDLGTVVPADSVYFSFFYQPQGNGFYPMPQDSLMLFFKTKYGGYTKVWSAPGTTLQPFTQVMIPITDTFYFDSFFQFRFINIAALNWSDAIWNVDYIRLGSNRTFSDTAIGDIGYSSNPSFLLNDYTSMPYRQFMADPASETIAQYFDSLHNNYNYLQTVNQVFTAKALNTGAVLQSPIITTSNVSGYGIQAATVPSYSSTIPLASVGIYDKVVFENKYYIESPTSTDYQGNDTIVKDQVFDNYLAYDDGSAEKSYYLNLFSTLPGKIAVEYHLNQPDTLKGMSIYFGRQIPFASYKYFSIAVYASLQGINGAYNDSLIYQQDYNMPGYFDSINHFWIYNLDSAIALPAGTFYVGTIQPAESGSDSLYIGLDVNRIGGNHAYYNVISTWNSSLISGALMIRPLLGQNVQGTRVKNVTSNQQEWGITPNPAKNTLNLTVSNNLNETYTITDIQGRTLLEGGATGGASVDISRLLPGMYFITITDKSGVSSTAKKFIKL